MDTLIELVSKDMAAVEVLLKERSTSAVATIPDMSGYLISAGGKRLRPLITLAAAYAAGGEGSNPLHCLATAVEFIHTATLLHDDVVDESDLRRGKKAAKMVWGNSASILVGDFLFARAFTLMVETRSIRILDILSNASCVIAEGEVKQLAAIGRADLPISEYMEIVEAKTAALFEAAARAGALTVVTEGAESDGLAEYGRRLGRAFQLVDDALDYDGTTSVIGKSVGDDFREGKLTLPVLLARQNGDATERAFWDRAMDVSKQTEADLDIAIDYIRKADSVNATLNAARDEIASAKAALSVLPPSPYVDALSDIADFVVDRAF
ncbi:polyprenyl synthetase family protein [Hirschia litorea]|uniref:Polyprenyl synthetase family protein n=2 Tax=Hirschia litorea TaxID=1199156 RepID=A0ABW2IIS8_9PROT